MYNNRQKPSFREGVDDIFITYFRSSGIWPACCHLFTYYHTLLPAMDLDLKVKLHLNV